MDERARHEGDPGVYLSRDVAERVLARAIEMEARRGEILTEEELFRIGRDAGIHPEYVRRALEAERADPAPRPRRGRKPPPKLDRDLVVTSMGGVVLLGAGLFFATVGEIGASLVSGAPRAAFGGVFVAVLLEAALVWTGILGLKAARES